MNQREKFEAWAAICWADIANFDMKDGNYTHMGIRNQWEVWQAAAAPNAALVEALKSMYIGYVYLLEYGRDKIIELGGDCDPLEQMEASDPVLCKARAALAAVAPPKEGA